MTKKKKKQTPNTVRHEKKKGPPRRKGTLHGQIKRADGVGKRTNGLQHYQSPAPTRPLFGPAVDGHTHRGNGWTPYLDRSDLQAYQARSQQQRNRYFRQEHPVCADHLRPRSYEFASASALMLLLSLLAVLKAQPSLGHDNSHNRRVSLSLCTSVDTPERQLIQHTSIPFTDLRNHIYFPKQYILIMKPFSFSFKIFLVAFLPLR